MLRICARRRRILVALWLLSTFPATYCSLCAAPCSSARLLCAPCGILLSQVLLRIAPLWGLLLPHLATMLLDSNVIVAVEGMLVELIFICILTWRLRLGVSQRLFARLTCVCSTHTCGMLRRVRAVRGA